jgi:CrcB protein
MEKVLLVGMGGFVGSIARYALAGGVHRIAATSSFPWGTLTVNIVGCALIGFLGGIAELRGVFRPETRLLVFIGVLGGFTTFSTFAYETLALARGGLLAKALGNAGFHLFGCLVAVWLGDVVARNLGAPGS